LDLTVDHDTTPVGGRAPEVIVDFDVREGLLFVSLKNIGDASAYEVSTRFDPPFRGLAGQKDIAGMNLFRKTEFMPPGKAFVQLVDPLAAYVSRKEPTRLSATISYRDRHGRQYSDVINHDLNVYLDLGDSIVRPPSRSTEPRP
jgi:hypothetical protein